MNLIYNYSTKKYDFEIEVYVKKIDTCQIYSYKAETDKLCQVGCKNYNKKYSCPPLSPDFQDMHRNYRYADVIFYKLNLEGYPQIYNSIRMANTVLKSQQRKHINEISSELNENSVSHIVLENGACRLCKPCKLQNNDKCKHPDKMRYSLESTGVKVGDLCKSCFGIELEWFGKDKFPNFQGVVSSILYDEESSSINYYNFITNKFSHNTSLKISKLCKNDSLSLKI